LATKVSSIRISAHPRTVGRADTRRKDSPSAVPLEPLTADDGVVDPFDSPARLAALPPELRLAGRFLTAGDMRRPVPRLSKVKQTLSRIPAERSLDWVARMIAPGFRGPAATRGHELAIANAYFTQSAGELRARDLVLAGERQLFAPYVLMYMGRLAVVHGSPKPAGDESGSVIARYDRLLLDAMLVCAHHTGSRLRASAIEAATDDHPAERPSVLAHDPVTVLDLELAANIMTNRKPFVASTFDRSERRWVEIPAEEGAGGDVDGAVDLAAEFEAATGARFADLRMIGVTLWAHTASGSAPHIRADHFDDLGLGQERTTAVLDLISADLAKLRAEAAGANQSEYDSSLFSQFPLVRCNDGSFIIMNESMAVERTLGWLPSWDLRGLAGRVPSGKRRSAQADGYLRKVTERHAVETIQVLADLDVVPGRLFDEKPIQRAYGTVERNADVVLVRDDAVIVIEVSSRTIMRGTAAASSPKDFATDLSLGILEKVTQIDSTINAVRADLGALTGQSEAAARRRFWPVLVTTEGWPVTPRMTQRIRRLLTREHLLANADVAPLNIVDIEGLETAESVMERTGLSLVTLLEQHQASALHLHGFRDWLIETFAPVRPTARIMDRWTRALDPALQALDAAEAHRENRADGEPGLRI
jgi:hypothetical protein